MQRQSNDIDDKGPYETYILAVRMKNHDRQKIEKLAECDSRSMSSWALDVLRKEILKRMPDEQ